MPPQPTYSFKSFTCIVCRAKAMPAHEPEQVWHSSCPCFILEEYVPLTRYLEMAQLLLCQSHKTAVSRSPAPKRAEGPLPPLVLKPKATDHPGRYAPHHARWCRNPVHRQAGPQSCWEVLSPSSLMPGSPKHEPSLPPSGPEPISVLCRGPKSCWIACPVLAGTLQGSGGVPSTFNSAQQSRQGLSQGCEGL